MRAIRYTALVTAVLIYTLIVLGALVRATNSGLSCPDWPTCYGHWVPLPSDLENIPNLGYTYTQVMLEWVHRLIAGVLVGPLVLVLAILTWRHRRSRSGLAASGIALLVLLLIQGALGGVTVLDANSPWSVALHLGTALLVFTTILRVYALASLWQPLAGAARIGMLSTFAWLVALLAMVSAAMTAKSGASLACSTWPSCDGLLIPDLGDPLVRIHFAHRALAFLVALTIGAIYLLSRSARHAAVRRLAGGAFLLVLGQVLLGALVIVLEVPVATAVLHQAVGVATFGVVTLLMWRCLPLGGRAGGHVPGESDGLALRST